MHKLLAAIKKTGYYIPFTVYVLLFAAMLIPGFMWLKKLSFLPDSAYTAIFSLLLTISLLFSISILCFGFITVLTSFIYFKWIQYKKEINFNLSTSVSDNSATHHQRFHITLNPVIIPLLGFIKVRMLYDSRHISEKFSPVSSKNAFFRFSFHGEFTWNLPEIREYRIEKMIVYFEDFFQFFSFAVTVNTENRFYISPLEQDLSTMKASPRKTEETTTRIEELKRVEGELINYKHFETNDDVRRIVWKIYAKNKELVVRIPEIMDPYASHIYVYTSFFSQFNVQGNAVVEEYFLNYYKTICWSVYKQLTKKGFEVKYVNDQPTPGNSLFDPEEVIKYAVSVSTWQQTTPLQDFVKSDYASVLIISSLSDAEAVKAFAENFGSDISIIYVPLTQSLQQHVFGHWLKWLFIETEEYKTGSYKTKWNLSPLRFKINENEDDLSKIVKQSSRSVII